jgi:ABC-type nitrate/sulfonate/bicarbonate transport system permease component
MMKNIVWPPAISLSLLLLSWQAIASFHIFILTAIWNFFAWQSPVPDWRFLSSPTALIFALPSELGSGSLLADAGRTFLHSATSFLIAFLLSLVLAILLRSYDWLCAGLEPIMKALSGIPPVMLLPILSLALGLGSSCIVALGILGATLFTSLIVLKLFQALPPDLTKMLENLGYSRFAIWMWELSTISSNLFLAGRECLRWSLILVVVGEMQIGDISHGIGYYVNSARLNQSYELVYLGIVACGVIILFFQVLLNLLSLSTHAFLKQILLRNKLSISIH